MIKVHLDTDIDGDLDDLCALTLMVTKINGDKFSNYWLGKVTQPF